MSLHILAGKAVRPWRGCVNSQEGPRDGGRICKSDSWHSSSSELSEGGNNSAGALPRCRTMGAPVPPTPPQTLVTM